MLGVVGGREAAVSHRRWHVGWGFEDTGRGGGNTGRGNTGPNECGLKVLIRSGKEDQCPG